MNANPQALPPALVDTEKELTQCQFKDTQILLELDARLRETRAAIQPAPHDASSEAAASGSPDDAVSPNQDATAQSAASAPIPTQWQQYQRLRQRLDQLLAENHEWQQTLLNNAGDHVEKLARVIEEGHVSEAQSLWDRSQNTLTKLSGNAHRTLQEKLAPYRPRITELLDWKKYADTEQKKALIGRMQQLIDNDMHLATRARKIRGLQEEWRKLGPAEDNDTLWNHFNEAARQAFEPCKEYFRERKELMRNNLIERNTICEQLEAYIDSLQEESSEINVTEINKLEATARKQWKQYAPVPQKKVKDLQARFGAILNRLRQLRRQTLQHNAANKKELVEKAEALLEHENLSAALNQAKQLQQQWKQLGPAPHKEERRYWQAFRGACDRLFAKRDETKTQQSQASREALKAARDKLQEIARLLDAPDDTFAQSRKEFEALRQAAEQSLTEARAERSGESRKLQDRLKQLNRRFEQRRRSTPDKKQLDLLSRVNTMARLCQGAEDPLLQGQTGSIASKGELEQEWQSLQAPEDKALAVRLRKRFELLCQHLDEPEVLGEMATANEASARELCVEMEIQAGVDSPPEDKALRMQRQLNHLKHGLGQNAANSKERTRRLSRLEAEFLCIGPLQPTLRNTLAERIQQIRRAGKLS